MSGEVGEAGKIRVKKSGGGLTGKGKDGGGETVGKITYIEE